MIMCSNPQIFPHKNPSIQNRGQQNRVQEEGTVTILYETLKQIHLTLNLQLSCGIRDHDFEKNHILTRAARVSVCFKVSINIIF